MIVSSSAAKVRLFHQCNAGAGLVEVPRSGEILDFFVFTDTRKAANSVCQDKVQDVSHGEDIM